MESVCTGLGSQETHTRYLNDGTLNGHPQAGSPYRTISAADIYTMAVNPGSYAKGSGPWIIPSSYHEFDSRSHEVQRDKGWFHWLAADIDNGSPPLAQVQSAVSTVLGSVYALIYSTASSTEVNRKWRVLVPVATALTGVEYRAYQTALFDALEATGLILDRALQRPGQLIYLPNRGVYYEHATLGAQFLSPKLHPMAGRAKLYLTLAKEGAGRSRQEGSRSHLAAFRRRHTVASLLAVYGYTQRGNSDHWRSPYQTSGSYATQDLGDGWFSLSQSDAAADLGRASAHGRYGDQFDLYVHYTCRGDYALGERYARQCLAEEDEARYGEATSQHGKEVWDGVCRAQSERSRQVVQTIQLDESEGNNEEWNIGWPPGLVGELAKWIYASSSRPVKQYSIAAALYFFSVTGRKYNVDGKGLNIYVMLVGGTGRGKGVVKTAVDRAVESLVSASQDPTLGAPFNYEVAVSEAGIRKGLSKQNPMCVYEEELGMTLLPLTSPRATANDLGLRKVITRLFDSGEGAKLGIKQASSQDNTKEMVHMPAFSLVGDTQPQVFRGLIGNGMVDTGFAPRMVPFFYYGKRSYHNEDSDNHQDPPPGLIESLKSVVEFCLRSSDAVVRVKWLPEVRQEYKQLDVEYTDKINAGEVGAEMFNRAGMIVARIAALLAVGVNHLDPVITDECYRYAKRVVWQGLQESQRILSTGGGGVGESVRLYHIREAIRQFIAMDTSVKIKSYKTPKSVACERHIINERYFLLKFKASADFAATGNGTTEQNIREAVEEAVRQEILEPFTDLMKVDKRSTQKLYTIGEGY